MRHLLQNPDHAFDWEILFTAKDIFKRKNVEGLHSEIKALSTHIQILLNPQIFLSGLKSFCIHTYPKRYWIQPFPHWRADSKVSGLAVWIHWIHVDKSHIRKEMLADSNVSGYMWKGPEPFLNKQVTCFDANCSPEE